MIRTRQLSRAIRRRSLLRVPWAADASCPHACRPAIRRCSRMANPVPSLAPGGDRSFSARTASPDGQQQPHMDFFGEPVTFLPTDSPSADIPSARLALDAFLMAAVTKGSSCQGQGGNDQGLEAQAAHSSAMVWAELLRHAAVWKEASPMLTATAVGPVLAQVHVGYLQQVDALLQHVEQGRVNLLSLVQTAVACRHQSDVFTEREIAHLTALDHLLKHERTEALTVLQTLLQQCPGDALALSMALDVAHTIGNQRAALRIAGTVASYWEERGWNSISGYSAGASLIALGFAAGGRFADAERLAERALNRDVSGCGGIASWALALAYDAEGRIAEGISSLLGDGARHYEGCGFLFFDSRLGGYGARFSVDREGVAGGGRAALRLYDKCFDRVFAYSGYSLNDPWQTPQLRVPGTVSDRMLESAGEHTKSIFQSIFGGSEDTNTQKSEEVSRMTTKTASIDDVLTWLPPTPRLLTDATLLLLRLTLNGTITSDDDRWKNIRNAWKAALRAEALAGGASQVLVWMPPLTSATVSLLLDSDSGPCKRETVQGMKLLGSLMQLRDESNAFRIKDSFEDEQKQNWSLVTSLLTSAYEETEGQSLGGWDIDTRPVLDHAVCHAACMADDYTSLCIARARCSQGVSLRPNSPEEWHRYSRVLESLGDPVAADDARAASISMGSGEGVAI